MKETFGMFWCNASDTFLDNIQIENKRYTHWFSEGG
jgi:hypothetical protein